MRRATCPCSSRTGVRRGRSVGSERIPAYTRLIASQGGPGGVPQGGQFVIRKYCGQTVRSVKGLIEFNGGGNNHDMAGGSDQYGKNAFLRLYLDDEPVSGLLMLSIVLLY